MSLEAGFHIIKEVVYVYIYIYLYNLIYSIVFFFGVHFNKLLGYTPSSGQKGRCCRKVGGIGIGGSSGGGSGGAPLFLQ